MKNKKFSFGNAIPLSQRMSQQMSRRQFVTGVAASSTILGLTPRLSYGAKGLGASPISVSPIVLTGNVFNLSIDYLKVNITGKEKIATSINGSFPCPTLRWKEGERVTLRVTNNLAHQSSLHWHGIILPYQMDGVPGISFGGINPGETFEYQFDVKQNGTYWYHSHSGFQEQTGLYGAIVIDPQQADPVSYDSEHIIMLSDWSDVAPETNYAKLKKMSDYYNFRQRTFSDTWRNIKAKGLLENWNEREMWNQMRMSQTDISDITAYNYTYLMNGITPDENWTGEFKKGEKVRLRFINASAMTNFDVRIPGLKMKVVASDGQNVQPFSVDEFRMGVAETYDVIVEPDNDSAYCIFAQSIDRSGYARGTLTSDKNLTAKIPAMDPPPTLQHGDMGMNMEASVLGAENSGHTMSDEAQKNNSGITIIDHSQHNMPETFEVLGKAGFGSTRKITHVASEYGPHIDMRAENPANGLHDPGIGLRQHQQLYGRKVLTYADIFNLTPTQDKREPSREIELHLTGNMHRYMWSINGIEFAHAEPLQLKFGERVRFVLVNDTMMTHPIHLHGLWSELETGNPDYIPRKHTVLVQPGSKISYLVTADALGAWAYHCHLLFHMSGMHREVRIS